MRYELLIPDWLPPRINQFRGRHWSREAKLKKHAANLLAFCAWQQDVPAATVRRRVALVVTLGPKNRKPDRDAYDKALLDALVTSRLLAGDSEQWLESRVEVEFRRGPKPKTLIVLEDC